MTWLAVRRVLKDCGSRPHRSNTGPGACGGSCSRGPGLFRDVQRGRP